MLYRLIQKRPGSNDSLKNGPIKTKKWLVPVKGWGSGSTKTTKQTDEQIALALRQAQKGEHIEVKFQAEAKRNAEVGAKYADEVWGPITSLYQYEPDVVHYVIKDIDDYSNGATYFFDNKIEIWTSALDYDLRGTHNWLRNVISHEFTHMVQIQGAMKTSRTVPAAFFQWLNYDDERRPDILYGYPNVVVSYPLATINVPAWFAEGTA